MEVLNVLSEHVVVFSVLIGILVLNFICIIYLAVKERKEDEIEINNILKDKKEEVNTNLEVEQDEKVEQNKKEVEEMLLKMQHDLETTPKDAVETFENEQEEQSIISYQELLASVKNQEKVNVTPVKIEEKEEPVVEEKSIGYDLEDEVQEQKFKNTEFISPIFGKQDTSMNFSTVQKKPESSKSNYSANTKNDEFLKALKDFRKSLD